MGTRYWLVKTKRATWKLSWTTHSVFNPAKGKKQFKAWRQKKVYYSDGTKWYQWKTVQSRFFSVRWRAKDWCWKCYCRFGGREFHSLHTVSEGRRKQGKRLQKFMERKELKKEQKKAGLKCARRRKVLRKKKLKEKEVTNE